MWHSRGGYVRVDDIMAYTMLEVPDYDLIVEGASFPSTAMVNYASTASATIVNIGKADVKEGELTAKIYLNDEEAASASVPAIASGESATIAIAFTPHQAGATTIRMAVEGVATADATAEMTVAEETTSNYVQVGEGSSLTSGGPFKFYNYRSITEIIYPERSHRHPRRNKILGLTFKGYYTGKNVQSNINVYIANESGTAFKGYDVTGMTQYSGVFDMTNGGGSSSNPIDVITVTFPEGIVYNGENYPHRDNCRQRWLAKCILRSRQQLLVSCPTKGIRLRFVGRTGSKCFVERAFLHAGCILRS